MVNVDSKGVYIGIEKYIFSDVYRLLTKYMSREYLDDNGWDCLWAEARALCEKYRNNTLCKEMLFSVIKNIEYKFKGTVDESGMTYRDFEMWNISTRNFR